MSGRPTVVVRCYSRMPACRICIDFERQTGCFVELIGHEKQVQVPIWTRGWWCTTMQGGRLAAVRHTPRLSSRMLLSQSSPSPFHLRRNSPSTHTFSLASSIVSAAHSSPASAAMRRTQAITRGLLGSTPRGKCGSFFATCSRSSVQCSGRKTARIQKRFIDHGHGYPSRLRGFFRREGDNCASDRTGCNQSVAE